jgi:hypothetical protein
MKSKDWSPKDFAKDTYEKIVHILQCNPGVVVLGHVTSEQSVIDMCHRHTGEHVTEDNFRIGMSIWVSHRNLSSCGRGMCFFRISKVGNFDDLEKGGSPSAMDEETIQHEFQSFMYALTRTFQHSNIAYRMSPAVLLFAVSTAEYDKIFTFNTVFDELPLVDVGESKKGGCSCSGRYSYDSDDWETADVRIADVSVRPKSREHSFFGAAW